ISSLIGRRNRSRGPDSAKFPVNFPVSREFAAETSSQLTASSATQSGLCGAFIPFMRAPRSLNELVTLQSGLTDPGDRSANKSRVSPGRCARGSAPAPLHHRANSAQMLKVGAQVGCNATALEKFRRPERGAPVSYRYSFEDLLALLHGRAPAKVDAVALHRRRVEHGHLSVGLKIHCLGGGSQFSTLVEGLGGAQKILDVNYYKHCHASLCLVLPPVGSARSAIILLV